MRGDWCEGQAVSHGMCRGGLEGQRLQLHAVAPDEAGGGGSGVGKARRWESGSVPREGTWSERATVGGRDASEVEGGATSSLVEGPLPARWRKEATMWGDG